MKILMFGWELPPFNSGGLGVACLGLTRALLNEGAEVIFVLPHNLPAPLSQGKVIFADNYLKPLAPNIKPHTLSYAPGDSRFKNTKNRFKNGEGHPLIAEVYWYAEAAKIISETIPHDIIHAHDWLTFPAGIAAKEGSGKPLVTHFHATEFDRTANGNINQAVYNIERAGIDEADQVITVSNYTKNILIERYSAPREKISVVHNCIDQDDIALGSEFSNKLKVLKDHNKKIVLFTGRLTIQKGPDYFLKTAKRVLEKEPNAIFIIAGSGDMEKQLMDECAWNGLGDRVLFAGFVRGEDLGNLYKAADVLVMPSVSEPFGLVPLESLLNNTPVIISKQSGVSEVIKNALKVDFWDTEETANKIISVLRYKPLYETLRIEGKKEALAQGWHKAAKAVIDLYKRLSAFLKKKI